MTAQEMPPETCPECGARMKPSREPLRISTKYVGTYDAMCCPVCKFYYFTEKEYDKALEDAEALGLGPQRRMVVSVGLQELVKDLPKVTAASSMEINIGQESVEMSSFAFPEIPVVSPTRQTPISIALPNVS